MSLFRLDASIRKDGSISREVADTVEKAWRSEHPHAPIIRRDLGLEPLPATAWRAAVSGMWLPEDERPAEQAEATALAAALVDELLDAGAYLFAVPLYNYGIPQHVKVWIDMVTADPRGTSVNGPLLEGRPATLVLVRGGGYAPGTPKEGWDHAGPYLKRILGDVWGLDLHVVEAELTLAGVNPAMESLVEHAERSRAEAHTTAEAHGLTIARRVRASTA